MSDNIVNGVVFDIGYRDWKNNIKLWWFQLYDNPTKYHCGDQNPPIAKGQYVEFEVKNGRVQVDGLSVSDNPPAEAAPAKPTGSVNNTLGMSVNDRIQWQAARKCAIQLVTTAMETNLLPFPKSGKAQDKWDRLLSLITKTTEDLLNEERNR